MGYMKEIDEKFTKKFIRDNLYDGKEYGEDHARVMLEENSESGRWTLEDIQNFIAEDSPTYIHYGHSKFDKDLFAPVKNKNITLFTWTKPTGGLWASRLFDDFGWYDYCTNEYWNTESLGKSFRFKLKPEANVCYITNADDALNLPIIQLSIGGPVIDFDKCVEMGIDAIELRDASYFSNTPFYGWDCQSILVMNPDIVVPV